MNVADSGQVDASIHCAALTNKPAWLSVLASKCNCEVDVLLDNDKIADFCKLDLKGQHVMCVIPVKQFKQVFKYFSEFRRKGSDCATGIFVLPKYANVHKYTNKMVSVDFDVPNVIMGGCSVPMQAWYASPLTAPTQVYVNMTELDRNKMMFDTYISLHSDSPESLIQSLADSGATHTVMSIKTVKRLGLKLQSAEWRSAGMANNTSCKIYGKVKFNLRLQGVIDTVTALVMDEISPNMDLILGMDWLMKNDVILHTGRYTASVRCGKNRFKIYANGFDGLHEDIRSAMHTSPMNYKKASKLIQKGAMSFLIDVTTADENYVHKQTSRPNIAAYAVNNADVINIPPAFATLIKEYADVFAPIPAGVPPDRGIGHVIPLAEGSMPAYRGMYRLSPVELTECCTQIRDLLEKKLIEPSTSPFSAPILFVSKPDGGLRMCLDFRMLNTMTMKNKAPLPRVDDLFDKLGGCNYFSSLDLQSGYHQIRIPDADVHKTAFNSPLGHFQWRVLTFGLTNAPATFQAEMNKIFSKQLNKFVLVYLDDILIYSKTLEDHLKHMRIALQVLRDAKLYAKLSKCEFCLPEVAFLGHLVGKDGIKVDPKKIKAVMNYPRPRTVTEVRSFLGLCNYFRKYVRGYSHIAHPLTELTTRDKTLSTWTVVHDRCFEQLKKALTEAPVLKIADFNKPFTIISDASIIGTGAVLLQDDQPIAYCSAKLTKPEKNYFTTEQELLGVIHALEEFRCYVEGGKHTVTLVTDHNPNTFLRSQITLSRRQARWVEFMERFDYKWQYIPGRDNMADPLSRTPTFALINLLNRVDGIAGVEEEESSIDLPTDWLRESALEKAIKAAYAADPLFSTKRPNKFMHLDDDGLWRRGAFASISKIVIPDNSSVRHAIMKELHDSKLAGHLGVKRTYNLVSRYFYWRGMFKYVEEYVQSCHSCQMMKSTNVKPAGLLQPLHIPAYPFQSVSMDLITGLPKTSNKFDTIVVMVCRLTKYVILIPTVEKLSAEGFAQLWVDHLVSKHGCPESIVSDRDVRFTSAFWKTLNGLVGAEAHMSTAFHPQSDGQTERMNRLLEETLRHFVCYNQSDWDSHLQMASFAINNAVNGSTKDSPFHLLKGFHPRLPCSFAGMFKPRNENGLNPSAIRFNDRIQASLATAKHALLVAQQNQKVHADKRRMHLDLKVGDWVMLSTKNLRLKKDDRTMARRKLLPKFIGPYKVTEAIGLSGKEVAFRLGLPEHCRIHDVFHVSLLRPYKRPSDEQMHGFMPQPLDWLDGMPMFEVDCIAGHKIVSLRGGKKSLSFLIKWKGYESAYDTWEPCATILEDIPSVLSAYIADQAHTSNPVPAISMLNRKPDAVPTARPKRKRAEVNLCTACLVHCD